MAKFYGQVCGNRSPATRTGTSGIKTAAQSYDGSVTVELWYDKNKELQIRIGTSDQSESFWTDNNFQGTLAELREALADYKKKKYGGV